MEEFIKLCSEIFCSISPYTAEAAKKAMNQFKGANKSFLISTTDFDFIKQGDIFTEIPFYFSDDNGEIYFIKRKAQLLSNTCDASREEQLLFAAMQPLSDFEENQGCISSIKQNINYSALYYGQSVIDDSFVDFNLINSISRKHFEELCKDKKIRRIASLNNVGYYMFLCKLAVFLMRPEDEAVNSNR